MTYRQRIADWLVGGNYVLAVRMAKAAGEQMVVEHNLRVRSNDALRAIIAQERPTSNATVKRCARIAREALGE
jgi:hypothetical protein